MTAPDARQSDELREAVMDVVSSVLSLYIGDDLPCAMTATVDALLPEVTAWHEKVAEAQARARAAEELRKAATAHMNGAGGQPLGWLLDRADALAADDRGITVAELALKFRAGALTVAPPLTRAPARVDSGVTTQGNVPGGEGDR